MLDDNNDRQLVSRLKVGDKKAFEEIFRKYRAKIYYFAIRYYNSAEDAENVVQDVFIKLWDEREGVKEELSLNNYIYTIAKNHLFNIQRKKINEKAYRSVEFLIDFFRSTPSSALIPLFLLIFGVSDVNKVAIAAFGAFLIVVFNSASGVINARKQRVMAARVMGASNWQIFKDVLVWESLQPSFVGLRSAVSMALVIVIVAEMFIGSDNGLGHHIIDAQQVLNVKSMYAAILAAGALGYALNALFLVAERRIVHWSGR